jgi:hypothetical protein
VIPASASSDGKAAQAIAVPAVDKKTADSEAAKKQ